MWIKVILGAAALFVVYKVYQNASDSMNATVTK